VPAEGRQILDGRVLEIKYLIAEAKSLASTLCGEVSSINRQDPALEYLRMLDRRLAACGKYAEIIENLWTVRG